MDEIRPKKCEPRELTKDQLAEVCGDGPCLNGGVCWSEVARRCTRCLSSAREAEAPWLRHVGFGQSICQLILG